MGIHIFALFSESYIQRKTFRVEAHEILHKTYKFYCTNVNNIKIKVYKKVLKEVADSFINNRINEICSQENLSAKEVIFFLVNFYSSFFLVHFLAVK